MLTPASRAKEEIAHATRYLIFEPNYVSNFIIEPAIWKAQEWFNHEERLQTSLKSS
jgi:hypothetical protein